MKNIRFSIFFCLFSFVSVHHLLAQCKVRAGNDQTLCVGYQYFSPIEDSLGIYNSVLWTTNGTGTFNSTTTQSPRYTPSVSDKTIGNSIFIKVEVNNSCGVARDSFEVTFIANPTVEVGPPSMYFCHQDSSVHLTAAVSGGYKAKWSGGVGTYLPNDSALTIEYVISSAERAFSFAGLYLTTSDENCAPVKDSILLASATWPSVTINTPASSSVCGNTLSLGASISGGYTSFLWSTTGSGTFTNPNTLATVYNASPADTDVKLFLTAVPLATNCPSEKDSLSFTITPEPLIDAGYNKTVCGPNVGLEAFSVNNPSVHWSTVTGIGSFDEEDQLKTIYRAHAADLAVSFVFLKIETDPVGNCPAKSDSILILFGFNQSVNAGPDQIVCGEEAILFGGSISLGYASLFDKSGTWSSSGTGTFAPSPHCLHMRYFASAADKAAGSVELTLTMDLDSTCAVTADSKTITFSNAIPPAANAGPDQIVTSGNITLNGTITGAATGGQWNALGAYNFYPNQFALNATYAPSQENYDMGYVKFQLTTTGNGDCQAAYDEMTVVLENPYSISGKVMAGSTPLDYGVIMAYIVTTVSGVDYISFFKQEFLTPSHAGNYVVDSLPSGKYILLFYPDYTVSAAYDYFLTYTGNVSALSGAQILEISSSDLTNQNISLIPISALAYEEGLNGNDTINGQVVQSTSTAKTTATDDTPVERAFVLLKNKNGIPLAFTVTDKYGFFYFYNVKSKEYLISVEYPEGAMVGSSLRVFPDGNPNSSEAVKLSVNRVSMPTSVLNSSAEYKNAVIAPNPAHNLIRLSLNETTSVKGQLRIMDMMGVVQYSSSATIDANLDLEVQVAALVSGCYAIEFVSEQKIFKAKFIKY